MLGLATALVERERQLDELTRLMRAPTGSVTVIEGEAGSGKTALLNEARRALPDKVEVWHARCEPLATPAPYAALYETMDRLPQALRQLVRSGDTGIATFAAALDELRRRPTVLLVDDLHWADTATAGLVRYLARRIADAPSAIVASYRADDLSNNSDVAEVVAELGRQGHRIGLQPLSVEGVAELATELAQGRSVDAVAVHRLTGGNPLFVVEVLRHDGDDDVPRSVTEIVAAAVRRLPLAAQRVVEAVALCPEGLEIDHATALSVDADEHVDLACERRLLAITDGIVRCRHELVRAAIDTGIPPVRRRQLHRQLVSVLAESERSTRAVAILAHHAAVGDLARPAVEYSVDAAATAIAARAHREAGEHLLRALRFREAMTADELPQTLDTAVRELTLSGRLDRAEELAEELLALTTAPSTRAGVLVQLAGIADQRGQCSRATELVRASVEVAAECPPWAAFDLATHVAAIAFREGRLDVAVDTYSTAFELARSTGDAGVIARAAARLATVRTSSGDDAAMARFEDAIDLALEVDADEHAAFAFNNLAATCVWRFDVPGALDAVARGLALTSARQLDAWHTSIQGSGAVAAAHAGDWRAAEHFLRFDPTVTSSTSADAEAAYVTAMVRLRRGVPDAGSVVAALRAADDAVEPLYMTHGYAAELALEAAWAGILPHRSALARFDVQRATEAVRHDQWLQTRLAFWALRLDAQSQIDDVVGPLSLERTGDHAAAAAAWDARRCPVNAAVTLAAMPDPPVDDVVARLEAIGAVGTLAAVRRDWRNRRINARGSAGPAHPSGLSARQLDVLALLATGRTYAEIARALYISEKTAGHHVSAILARLGVSTRRRAVDLAVDRGWVTR